MNYILLIVSVFSTMTGGIINSIYGKKKAKNEADFQLFNLIGSLICSAVILAVAVFSSSSFPSSFTVLLALVFGVVTALGAVFTVKALSKGPVSYTTLITTSSMIIPALSGWIFWHEEIGITKIFGIVLMLISVALAVINKEDGKQKTTIKWLFLALAAGLFSGLVGVLQKIHQSSEHSGELMYFLVIAFSFSAVYSASTLFVLKQKKIKPTVKFSLKSSAGLMFVGSGAAIALPNMINLYLSGVMSSIVFFPVVNGSNLLLMLLVSVVLFREKLRKAQWFGFAIGCTAIALLCL